MLLFDELINYFDMLMVVWFSDFLKKWFLFFIFISYDCDFFNE